MSISKRKIYIISIKILLIAFLFAMSLNINNAESYQKQISIRSIDTSQYPKISFKATFSDTEESDLPLLSEKDFLLKENGKKISDIKIKPISKKSEPLSVVLVFDTSASMRGKPLQDAKNAARTFIEFLKPEDQIAIISFGSNAQIISKLNNDKEAKSLAIDSLEAKGETFLYDALIAGLNISSEASSNNKSIIVISDGKDTKSEGSVNDVLKQLSGMKIPIYGIGLQSPEYDHTVMKKICDSSEGELLLTPDSGGLKALFLQLAKNLHNQYLITYKSIETVEKDIKIKLAINTPRINEIAETTIDNPSPIKEKNDLNKFIDNQSLVKVTGPTFLLVGAVFLGFISIFLFTLSIFSIIFSPRNNYKKNLEFYESVWKKVNPSKVGENATEKIIVNKTLNFVDYLASPLGFKELIQLKMEQAGLPLRPLEFIFFHFIFTLIMGFIGSLFSNTNSIIFMALLGASIPIVIIFIITKKRRARFHNQIPDTLNLISSSLRSGYSLLQAFNVASEEAFSPMSDELKRVLTENRLGLPLGESLEIMARRVQEQNFSWTVMAINIQREVGGNLAQVLEVLAETIRERDNVYRQIKTLTAEGRLSAIILVVLPFVLAFILTIINTKYMALLITTNAGLLMLIIGSILMITGIIWLKKIVTIEV